MVPYWLGVQAVAYLKSASVVMLAVYVVPVNLDANSELPPTGCIVCQQSKPTKLIESVAEWRCAAS